jgi:hypothetical protein
MYTYLCSAIFIHTYIYTYADLTVMAFNYISIFLIFYQALLIGKFEFSELCWSIVMIPLVITECILLSHMKYILIKQYKGIIRMNKRQIICLFCYSISITSTILTNIVTVYNDIKNKNINSESKVFEDHTYLEIFPMIAWIFIVILFLGAILAIFDQEMNDLARSRGFTTPLELSR